MAASLHARFTQAQVAEALGLARQAVNKRALREKWPGAAAATHRQRVLYAIRDLPEDVQAALILAGPASVEEAAKSAPKPGGDAAALLQRFQQATPTSQAAARERLSALLDVEARQQRGEALTVARQEVAADLQARNVRGGSVDSLKRWAAAVKGQPRDTWLAHLLPSCPKGNERVEIHPELWAWYLGHYLTREQPSHADTYRRAKKIAKAKGWPMPSAKTLQRRMNEDVPTAVQVLQREGPQARARLLPPMQRDTTCFEVGEAVNGDGLKFDRLWVAFPGRKPINTATGWFWQDVRSKKILAWRLGETENTDLFRLATYDLAAICAPSHVYLDNTRVAANKVMTGGASHRNRFKRSEADGRGLLLAALGAEVHFTNPDKERGNPGAKPIERAFGKGGIHEMVATHPRIMGRGFSQATAIPVEELRAVIAEEVARHNAQKDRRGFGIAPGNSFDDEWAAGVARRPPTQLSKAAREMFLWSFEVRTVQQTGFIELAAGRSPYGRNRYWSEASACYSGERVAVYFDPGNLRADVHVYSLEGRYLFDAQHVPAYAFNDTAAAREHAKFKERELKATKKAAEALGMMSNLERDRLFRDAAPEQPLEPIPTGGPVRLNPTAVQPSRDAQRAVQSRGRKNAAVATAGATMIDSVTDFLEAHTREANPLFDMLCRKRPDGGNKE